jgi:hypothetical protein
MSKTVNIPCPYCKNNNVVVFKSELEDCTKVMCCFCGKVVTGVDYDDALERWKQIQCLSGLELNKLAFDTAYDVIESLDNTTNFSINVMAEPVEWMSLGFQSVIKYGIRHADNPDVGVTVNTKLYFSISIEKPLNTTEYNEWALKYKDETVKKLNDVLCRMWEWSKE